MNRYVITRMAVSGENILLCALFNENKKLVEVRPNREQVQSILGNVYVGRVENVVKNLNAAFIRISPDTICYYPMEEYHHPVFTKKLSEKKPLVAGDELLVQVKKEALKTKDPMVTTNISLTGKYVVFTTENTRFGISSKLDAAERTRLSELLKSYKGKETGLIVRTNAKNASDAEICREAQVLTMEYEKMTERAQHAVCFNCLKQAEPEWLSWLKDMRSDCLEEIVTDDREIFETVCAFFGIEEERLQSPRSVKVPVDEFVTENGTKLHYHREKQISLAALYGLKSQLADATKKRVWMKSGAYLIIEPTEALTVIDVNTGKNVAKKEAEEQFFAVNREAAIEVARQLRLRNLSGIIVVDFVNLKSEKANRELLQMIKKLLAEDPIQTNLVDMTPLGLVEITRKKVRKSLTESIGDIYVEREISTAVCK
jgi:ribonuclease G